MTEAVAFLVKLPGHSVVNLILGMNGIDGVKSELLFLGLVANLSMGQLLVYFEHHFAQISSGEKL